MNDHNEQTTIMLVDDTPANLELLRAMLHKKGYKVLVFPGGEPALRALERKEPDLILLDIMMPEMNGFEVCGRLKEDERLREIPVIFISALDDTQSKVRAFTAGGVDYVTKPFQPEEILARVQTHVTLRQVRRELEKHMSELEELVREKVKEISDSQMATIHAMSKLAEYRDDQTGRHIERTRELCAMLAGKLRENPRYALLIDDSFIENIYHAALLHDIGKVGIPDAILLKPGKLTEEEFEIIKRHPRIGATTLSWVRSKYPQNAFINMGIALALFHHERWDGGGYPDGLAGEDIPLSARIMALVDVYDALRSDRPYKEAFPHETACRIIREGNGTHFDPSVVDAFFAVEQEFEQICDHMTNEGAEGIL